MVGRSWLQIVRLNKMSGNVPSEFRGAMRRAVARKKSNEAGKSPTLIGRAWGTRKIRGRKRGAPGLLFFGKGLRKVGRTVYALLHGHWADDSAGI